MSLLTPVPNLGYFVTNDDSPASGTSYGTNLPNVGTANTKGAWTTLGITPTYDIYMVTVCLTAQSTAAASVQGLVDIGIGPDSSNVTTIVENLLSGSAPNITNNGGRFYTLPLYIPAGVTVFARQQASTTTDTVQIAVNMWGGISRPNGLPAAQFIEAIGVTTASSTGTSITPGANGALGSYAQLTASSASDYFGIIGAWACTDTTMSNVGYTEMLGIGAATEQELGLTAYGAHNSSEFISSNSIPIFADIPSGTRIAAKMSCTGTADATMSAAAWGFVR